MVWAASIGLRVGKLQILPRLAGAGGMIDGRWGYREGCLGQGDLIAVASVMTFGNRDTRRWSGLRGLAFG
ncbi:MAG: hypothetical protein QOJ51_1202 [Acidobacteriaceae bacterium]|nr:hypothetical protein [Acidobacteriaceae bacterium]